MPALDPEKIGELAVFAAWPWPQVSKTANNLPISSRIFFLEKNRTPFALARIPEAIESINARRPR